MKQKQCAPLETATIEQLKALQGATPPYRFAALLGVSRPTLAAALGGLELHPGSRLLLTLKIRELAGHGAQVETGAAA